MSGYKNYGQWNKSSSSSSYSGSSKKETIPKYESTFGRNRTEAGKRSDEDKNASSSTSRIATKYTGAYSAGYQRDTTARDTGRGEHSRIKPLLDKKDTLHPPVSYRPLSRTGARSRDPSPVEKSEKSSSSSSSNYNLNRLYPRPYTRSVSRERTESPLSPSTIPKYMGRSSLTKEDSHQKYGNRASSSKDEIPKYTGRSSISKDEPISRYKSTTRTSREDLSNPQKYISSRFLPKNTIEKSYTAYTRPSTLRTNETSRKNRELLNVLHAQHEQERLSRPPSRCSSVTPEEIVNKEATKTKTVSSPTSNDVEMETVTVVTRGTSPTLSSTQSNFLRSRRIEVAKVVEKQITRPKKRIGMIDKEMQSDRLDDSTKSSRFAGASRISATPWSSILDMKFSSPNTKQKSNKDTGSVETNLVEKIEEGSNNEKNKTNCDSPKSISRTSSTKSLSQSSSKSDGKPKDKKSPSPSFKSKITPPKQIHSTDKKQLPPQIPKADHGGKNNSLHSLATPNKDFRKSVLNMNLEGKGKKGLSRRSNSASSAESDQSVADAEATDISENLTSCKSYHKPSSSNSKLPQKICTENIALRIRRSPSSDASTSSSSTSSEDDMRKRGKSKILRSGGSSRTSMILSSADELSTDKPSKPIPVVKQKEIGKAETAEAKSFIMRALAPVTNLFKAKHQENPEKSNNFEAPIENTSDIVVNTNQDNCIEHPRQATLILTRVEPEESSWYIEDSSEPSSNSKNLSNNVSQPVMDYIQKPTVRHVDSGEIAWWLDENSEIPEGVDTYPNYVKEDGTTLDGKVIYKIRRNESCDSNWWLDSSEKTSSNSQKQNLEDNKLSCIKEDGVTEDGRVLFKVRHNTSDESSWWVDSEKSKTDSSNQKDNSKIIYAKDSVVDKDGRTIYRVRHNESDESSWWIDSSDKTDSNKQNKIEPDYFEKHKIRHIDSGDRAWWISSSENISEMVQVQEENENRSKYAIRHQDSGERAWWLKESETKKDSDESDNEIPLGDRASPEGLEMPKDDNEGRLSPYDNVPISQTKLRAPTNIKLFISKHTNIDEILGGTSQLWCPVMDNTFTYDNKCTEIDAGQVIIHENSPQRGVLQPKRMDNIGGFPKAFSSYGKYLNDIDPFSYTTNFPDPARPPLHTFSVTLPLINQLAAVHRLLKSPHRLDDAALQLYKDGDYGSYLDLEASISEQQEEFEGFQSNKKNSIVLRTQLSVRVHTIIEKLLTSEGRELRRALFSLKQIFQEDKDLVHEFVQNDGLSCLIKVGSEADQNYQNYILRALGQVMLYVDGMNGVMDHNPTIQWLYSLISSKFRLVVKTALKLLLVFVEYTDSNCMLLIKAIHTVDYSLGLLPYHNIMKLLKDFDSADTELLIYATTLINKLLNGVSDQDTYYDQTDALEEQGIEAIIQRYMSKPGTDLDLLQQFQIYEAVLKYEDGEEVSTPIRHLDENIRKTLRSRKAVVESSERRKSRRHSTGNTPLYGGLNRNNNNINIHSIKKDDDESSSSQSSDINSQLNGSYKDSNKAVDAGVTPALKRRRERAERQRSFMREQQETAALLKGCMQNGEENNKNLENGNYTNALQQRIANGNGLNRNSSRKDLTPLLNAVNKLESEDGLTKQPWILSMIQNQDNIDDESENTNENERNVLLQLKRENTVKDLTQKLANQNILHSPSDENKVNRIGDMTGLISKAKEGLAKSKSKADVLKSPTSENVPKIEVKKSENELRWEELVSNLNRSLNLCDMDFTDLATDDETDVLAPAAVTNGIPPPPPPLRDLGPAPPPPPLSNKIPPPIPPVFGVNLQRLNKPSETKIPIKKNKKTVKLFWKEVRDDPISNVKLKTGFIWDELTPVCVDTQKLEHLFESRAKDLITKKQQEMNKNKEIIVLDPKRSNAINIGMTKLPPPRSIKTAILKMDATIMNREGIEKLLTMLPTEEERTKIQEAQAANPDLPLGSAEQFLLTLASISELPARLKLWAFKLDFENSEREIAEPLMDLKQGFEVLKINKTFRGILSTLLSIGNFLNGNEVKGFQIEYLAKVPEVKDTVHKHSLLHHLCHIVMDKFPEATDLYSEIGAITRASKVDFDELTLNIQRLEADCKASWDHLKLIAKHDGSTMMKVKMSDFLSDCAERIILLGIIHRRIMNRFHKFLLWLGIPLHQITDTKPNEFCRIISEFALEYRTTRERVLQQLEKKANHRERNKTRGKMITDIGKFRTKEDRADAELRQLLGSDMSDVESMQGTLPWRRTRRDNRSFMSPANGNMTDGDDEILESLVKTATKGSSRTAPRERKRTRHADRKSLKRSRTRENMPFGSRDSP